MRLGSPNHIPWQQRSQSCPHCQTTFAELGCFESPIRASEPGLLGIDLRQCPACRAVDVRGVYESEVINPTIEAELDLCAKLYTELAYAR